MANETVQEGFEVFVGDDDKPFGAVRQVRPHGRSELVVYVENAGDFTIPLGAIEAVHSQKVIVDSDKLDHSLRKAIGRSRSPMREVLRSNDAVVISFSQTALQEVGITNFLADEYMSAAEGSIGAFPRRLLVEAIDWAAARRALVEAGVGSWLVNEGRPTRE